MVTVDLQPPPRLVQRARRRRPPRVAAAAVTLLLAAPVAACTADDPADDAVPPSSVVVQPGRPGEGNTTVQPEDYEARDRSPEWNQADADFVTGMILHHRQALDMSELAPDRAQDPAVRSLASRIYDTQGAEIHGMAAWLQERDLPVPVEVEEGDGSGPRQPDAGHDHEGMPGMLSEAQLAELEQASGAEFDELYLAGMIQHHEGAITMSTTVMTEGVDERAHELANDIGAGQLAEIGRMQELLDGL
ncbi:uncharacterized protein (DUF305 family) [Isoptericola sp. CG 20/1183]|uniref:Uncharacterized protein (DUF305 family) n=1 Tax=Isoptericola halotolerans TaxID=300560 RepID=A0ABX5EJT0_9MICO|nr:MULTISPECIES: DUF305 domain-containing protein [Isoptericola]PRZ08561.1 uncharacterized protein (DUF305 family) [Isoptericola halotolerans]PRZ10992.1 uncharacterized protein (DUF305 family) [Isoptericola sp. CG 20/1183]